MGRPRIDRVPVGKPRSAWCEARRKDGNIDCFYLRFRDAVGQVHTVETIRTTSRAKAEARRDEWLEGWGLGDRRLAKNTRDAVEQFLATKQGKAAATQETYRERIEDFCAYMNWVDFRSWSFSDFGSYLQARQSRPGYKTTKTGARIRRRRWKPATAKTHATSIQTFLTWLYEEDLTPRDIGKDRKGRRFALPTVESVHARWISYEDYCRLMAALADPDSQFPMNGFGASASVRERLHSLEPAVALGALGLRLYDIQVLKVGSLHRGRGLIDVQNMKGKSSRTVPMPTDVAEVMARHGVFERGPDEFVMSDPRFRDRGRGKSGHDRRLVQSAATCLGVYDNFGEKLTWHTLRRSCGVWLALAGRSESDIGKALGHRPGSPVTKRYVAAAGDKDLHAAWLASRV